MEQQQQQHPSTESLVAPSNECQILRGLSLIHFSNGAFQ